MAPERSNETLAADVQQSGMQLQQAEDLRLQHRFGPAQTICENLVRRHPDYMAALHTLGLIFADQQKYEDALDCLVRATLLNPQSWQTLAALGGVYLRLGSHEMARRAVEQARAIAPHEPSVLIALADVYRERRQYGLAKRYYRETEALDQNAAAAAVGRAWCCLNLEEYAEAASLFEGLIRHGSRSLEPIRGLCMLPAEFVGIDLNPPLDRAFCEPGEDRHEFESSIPFMRAIALDRAGRREEAWAALLSANRQIFASVQHNLAALRERQKASLAVLAAWPASAGPQRESAGAPISLFIFGPSRAGKSTMEKLVSALPNVSRGFESTILRDAVRWTFQSSGLLTSSSLQDLPSYCHDLCRETYLGELKRRGVERVFTNTLTDLIHDAAHIASILPNVRFIVMKRRLEDNLLSVYRRKYMSGNAYAYDLAATREHLAWYDEMADLVTRKFPRITRTVHYEEMIENPQQALRQAAELCASAVPDGLQLTVHGDPGCAAPYRSFMQSMLEPQASVDPARPAGPNAAIE